MDVSKIVEEIARVLDEKDEVRERTLKITREIVRLSGDAIKALHRKSYKFWTPYFLRWEFEGKFAPVPIRL